MNKSLIKVITAVVIVVGIVVIFVTVVVVRAQAKKIILVSNSG